MMKVIAYFFSLSSSSSLFLLRLHKYIYIVFEEDSTYLFDLNLNINMFIIYILNSSLIKKKHRLNAVDCPVRTVQDFRNYLMYTSKKK